jgi:hypothetical protein
MSVEVSFGTRLTTMATAMPKRVSLVRIEKDVLSHRLMRNGATVYWTLVLHEEQWSDGVLE